MNLDWLNGLRTFQALNSKKEKKKYFKHNFHLLLTYNIKAKYKLSSHKNSEANCIRKNLFSRHFKM